MSNPVSVTGADLTDRAGRQVLQDALDTLYGLIQASKGSGAAGTLTTIEELRVKLLTVTGSIDVVPQDKPPANEATRQIVPWLTGQRGRGFVMRYDDQNDGGDLLEWRFQPYLIGSPTSTTGDWELRAYTAQRDPAGAFRSKGALVISEDGRLRLFDATEVEIFDSDDYSATPAFPKRFVEGLVIRYATTSTITVSAGKARDKADGANMTLSSGVTVELGGTANSALTYERKALTGTASFTNASVDVEGTSTLFFTEFGVRAVTGATGTSSGATLTLSADVTSQYAVNDLIGNTTRGYFQIVAIPSATTVTLVTTPGVAFSAESLNVIEQPVIETAGGKRHPLARITANSGVAAAVLGVGFSGTETGVAVYATSGANNPTGVAAWRAVWLLSGGSGTTVALSTQRTTPYLSITGYTTSYRRIGWVRVNSSGNLLSLDYYDSGGAARRQAYYRGTNAPAIVVNNASSILSTATAVDFSASVPPTSSTVCAYLGSLSPNTVSTIVLICRGYLAGTYRPADRRYAETQAPSTSTTGSQIGFVTTDGAQQAEHYAYAATTGDGTYVLTQGFEEDLE